MEEENKNIEAEEPTEVLGNTGVIEPVVETPTEPVVETPVEPVVDTPAPEQAPAPEVQSVVETPAAPAAPVPEAPVEQPVEQPTVEPVASAPTPEEPKKEEKKGSNKLLIIVALLVLVLGGGYAVWAFVLGGNTPKTEPKKDEEQKEEEKKPEEDEEENSEKLTEEQVKEIYAKYHSNEGQSDYTNTYGKFETEYAYKEDKFDITSLKELTPTFDGKIYEIVKDDISDKVQTEGERNYYKAEDIEGILEKAVTDFFGGKVKFDKSLFVGCHVLVYLSNSNTYEYSSGCGGTDISSFKYEMTNYKLSDDEKTLTIEEKVTFKTPEDDGPKEEVKNYKWTYTKYEDTYVLSTIELVKE